MNKSTIPQKTKIGRPCIDMSGQVIGRLTVLRPDGTRHGQKMWLCRCECGNETTVFGSALRRKNATQSCGCYAKEEMSKTKTTHGMSKSPEFSSWQSMIARCYYEKDKCYGIYGARGITVCESWRDSFESFYADMGNRPSPQHSIDRIDSDGNYEPSNCRWATGRQQGNNRRDNVRFSFQGETLTVPQWARKVGIKTSTLDKRINGRGWSVERALTEPVRKSSKGKTDA